MPRRRSCFLAVSSPHAPQCHVAAGAVPNHPAVPPSPMLMSATPAKRHSARAPMDSETSQSRHPRDAARSSAGIAPPPCMAAAGSCLSQITWEAFRTWARLVCFFFVAAGQRDVVPVDRQGQPVPDHIVHGRGRFRTAHSCRCWCRAANRVVRLPARPANPALIVFEEEARCQPLRGPARPPW